MDREPTPPYEVPVQRVQAPLLIQYGPTLRSYKELPVTIGSLTPVDASKYDCNSSAACFSEALAVSSSTIRHTLFASCRSSRNPASCSCQRA